MDEVPECSVKSESMHCLQEKLVSNAAEYVWTTASMVSEKLLSGAIL